ncbi:MAG TPA: type II toxin-antitoxin system Phd/YefM family antitoxin [Acidimicrobiia bacterium]|nr:type II toxin-antitoxin system Phd/YefM family antitoxin [Acidimicrobiia bacterium]
MSEVIPFSKAKAHLSELADRIELEHDRILVTRNGRPSFVLMSPDDLESLEETLEIVRDDELMDSIRRSREESARGERLRLRDQV